MSTMGKRKDRCEVVFSIPRIETWSVSRFMTETFFQLGFDLYQNKTTLSKVP